MLIRAEEGFDFLPFALDMHFALQLLIGDMVFFYLFIEGEEVFNLDIGQCLDEPLVAGIVYPNVLLYLCLAFFIHFR